MGPIGDILLLGTRLTPSGDDRSGFMGEIGGLKNETAKETTSSKYAFHSLFLKVN
jgi:hypothetical protein